MHRLCEMARKDNRICLVVGDLGFSVVEPFIKEFPERFLNAGVAEQSMTGIAAGWSLAEGKVVFTYSLANFPTMRCLEQVRNDCCAHKANVKIISLGSGITYGQSGYSHFAIEDLAIMNAMPNMTIFVPADPVEARRCFDLAVKTTGPAYIRLARNGESVLNNKCPDFNVGDFIEYKAGVELCLIGVGTILSECLGAAKLLETQVSSAVIGLPCFKPLNENKLVEYLKNFSLIVTAEEHSPFGGLGSVIAEIIALHNLKVKFLKLTLPEGFDKIGPQQELLKFCGLNGEQIAKRVREILSNA